MQKIHKCPLKAAEMIDSWMYWQGCYFLNDVCFVKYLPICMQGKPLKNGKALIKTEKRRKYRCTESDIIYCIDVINNGMHMVWKMAELCIKHECSEEKCTNAKFITF